MIKVVFTASQASNRNKIRMPDTIMRTRANRRRSRGVLRHRKRKIVNLLTPRASAAKTSLLSASNLSVRNNKQKEDRKHATSSKIRKKSNPKTISKNANTLTGTTQTKPIRSIGKRRRWRTSSKRRRTVT